MKRLLGLDVGGANIKAAHSNGESWSEAFALWRAPADLASRLVAMVSANSPRDFDEVRLTMTAELCDCFATKRDGVHSVVGAVEKFAGDRPVKIWSTLGRFFSPAEARANPLAVAASNWHALGTLMARRVSHAPGLQLLIDIGSTTTDIIRLRGGRIDLRGLNDMDRLASGELVYTGAWRTPLMAMGPAVQLRGRSVRLMAEYFASMADVHLLLKNIPEEPDNHETADNRSATRAHAAARIVRMVGADLDMLTMNDAVDLARQFAQRQNDQISAAISHVLGGESVELAVVSGQGSFIARQLELIKHAEIIDLTQTLGREASIAACAWALLRDDLTWNA